MTVTPQFLIVPLTGDPVSDTNTLNVYGKDGWELKATYIYGSMLKISTNAVLYTEVRVDS